MANYNKSFNFRNGVQVDNDNFIVNANGLVGIGTTIPRDYLLNVYGDARFTGIITAPQLSVDNATVESLNANEIVSTGVITATSFSGSASGLTGIFAVAVDGWYISGGNISTTSNVGIGTTLPIGNFQVGSGVTINNDGNATYTGIVTATEFVGIGSNITQIDADNILSGTLDNSRLPNDINISGIITASSFTGNLTGTATSLADASNIITGTISPDRLSGTYDISITGNVSSDTIGVGTATVNNDIIVGNGVSITSNGNIYSIGIVTATEFVGDLTGTASTAQNLSGNPSISVTDISALGDIFVGSNGNAFTSLNSGLVGIGTSLPSSELQIRKASESLLEVISDSGEATISIGQSVGVGNSTAVLIFGSSDNTLDIANNDIGNINLVLHRGNPGINTGRFDWIYGQTNTELMSLTYDGNLGLGKTDPENTLHVVGTSTVTSDSYIGNDLYVANDINVTGSINGNIVLPDTITSNINASSGVSTVASLNIFGSGANRLGIGTDDPQVDIDATGKIARFGSVGVATDNAIYPVDVNGSVRASGGFLSDGSNPVQIYLDGSDVVLYVVGVGSVSLALS